MNYIVGDRYSSTSLAHLALSVAFGVPTRSLANAACGLVSAGDKDDLTGLANGSGTAVSSLVTFGKMGPQRSKPFQSLSI
jgi:hypothetical protein